MLLIFEILIDGCWLVSKNRNVIITKIFCYITNKVFFTSKFFLFMQISLRQIVYYITKKKI